MDVPTRPPPMTTTSARSITPATLSATLAAARRSPFARCYGPPPDLPTTWEALVPSPRDDSLFVPSRTAEHARTFVSWPCREELWGGLLDEAEAEYAAVVEAIARHEPVTVIAAPGSK